MPNNDRSSRTCSLREMLLLSDPNMQMRDGRKAMAISPLDADEVMARLLETMHRACVTVLGQLHDIAVTLHHDLRTTIAEVPGFLAVRRAEGSHQERHRVAWLDAEGRRVDRVNRRRQLV